MIKEINNFKKISKSDLVKIIGGKVKKSDKNKVSNFFNGLFHGLK